MWARQDSYVWETWLICERDRTDMCGRHDSYVCETWLICVGDMTHMCGRHDSYVCETGLICVGDMTHMCARQDWYVCETWRHDSFVLETWQEGASIGLFGNLEVTQICNFQISGNPYMLAPSCWARSAAAIRAFDAPCKRSGRMHAQKTCRVRVSCIALFFLSSQRHCGKFRKSRIS